MRLRLSEHAWATRDDGTYKPSTWCAPAGLFTGLAAGAVLPARTGLALQVIIAWMVAVLAWMLLESARRLAWKREAPARAALARDIRRLNQKYEETGND